jgi:hypothetical protein
MQGGMINPLTKGFADLTAGPKGCVARRRQAVMQQRPRRDKLSVYFHVECIHTEAEKAIKKH